jgi:hypothetical protein
LQLQEPDRLERLRRRLANEDRRKQVAPRILRFSRPLASLAAVLLLAIGLAGPVESPPVQPGESAVAQKSRGIDSHAAELFAPARTSAVPAEARGKASLTPGTVVQHAPGSEWHILSGSEIKLSEGQLRVQFDPPYRPGPAPLLTVKTPAGVLTTHAADFTVTAGQGAAAEVLIRWGHVDLSNDRGRVIGGRGDVLQTRGQEPPRRRP